MFTGIIEETGKVKFIKSNKDFSELCISTKNILKKKRIGQSIAVNGVCTTITKISGKDFYFKAIPETLQKTNLSSLKTGDQLNLESALKLNGEIDGHLVQGHVDDTGTIEKIDKKNKTRFTIKPPKKLMPFVAEKGSICLNGVSLTVSKRSKTGFSVDLIPLTLKKTNLDSLKKGDKVNLEIDLIARYLKTLVNG